LDALSDVLRVARLTGGVFLRAHFTAPWCVASQMEAAICAPYVGPASHLVQYHYIVEGTLKVRLASEPEREFTLGPDEAVIFPHNHQHHLGSDLTLHPIPSTDLVLPPGADGLYAVRHGGDGPTVRMICGFLGCDFSEGNPVLANLPKMLRLSAANVQGGDWIRTTFAFAAQEIAAGRPGSETVLAKLSELLFVEAIRRHVESLEADATGWLAGLRDPYVSRVLSLFHADVSRHWTLDEIGREVGLSRSALADRFLKLMGMPPFTYLGQWRLQVASQQLRNTTASLAQVADAVGYESEASFSRAFKREFGTAPATWRRTALEAAA